MYELTAVRARRMWRTQQGPDPLRRREHDGLELSWIEEVALPKALRKQPIKAEAIAALPVPKSLATDDRMCALDPWKGTPTAALPPAACHVCGKAPAKRCAACMGPAYCGKECQVGDWAKHKKDCKAARAKQTAAAGGAAGGE